MANKKTPGVAKKKVNWKIYLRNTWQLYAMMLIPDYLADLFQI